MCVSPAAFGPLLSLISEVLLLPLGIPPTPAPACSTRSLSQDSGVWRVLTTADVGNATQGQGQSVWGLSPPPYGVFLSCCLVGTGRQPPPPPPPQRGRHSTNDSSTPPVPLHRHLPHLDQPGEHDTTCASLTPPAAWRCITQHRIAVAGSRPHKGTSCHATFAGPNEGVPQVRGVLEHLGVVEGTPGMKPQSSGGRKTIRPQKTSQRGGGGCHGCQHRRCQVPLSDREAPHGTEPNLWRCQRCCWPRATLGPTGGEA